MGCHSQSIHFQLKENLIFSGELPIILLIAKYLAQAVYESSRNSSEFFSDTINSVNEVKVLGIKLNLFRQSVETPRKKHA